MNIKEITDAANERKREELQKAPLSIVPEDECCAKRLTKELHRNPEMIRWTCPKCGTDWKTADSHDVRTWEPVVIIEVFR
jgi:hypothetical protein